MVVMLRPAVTCEGDFHSNLLYHYIYCIAPQEHLYPITVLIVVVPEYHPSQLSNGSASICGLILSPVPVAIAYPHPEHILAGTDFDP